MAIRLYKALLEFMLGLYRACTRLPIEGARGVEFESGFGMLIEWQRGETITTYSTIVTRRFLPEISIAASSALGVFQRVWRNSDFGV